jgi:hypothetical protein
MTSLAETKEAWTIHCSSPYRTTVCPFYCVGLYHVKGKLRTRKMAGLGKIVFAIVAVLALLVAAIAIYNTVRYQEAIYYAPMKDATIEFIASNHADAEEFLTSISFTYIGGGRFIGGGWVLTFSGSTMNGTAAADFSIARTQNSTGIPHRILWSGAMTNATVVETSYSHAV